MTLQPRCLGWSRRAPWPVPCRGSGWGGECSGGLGGDSAAWCEMHWEKVAAMGAAMGLQWFLALGVFRGVVAREEQGNKCNG